MNNWSTEFYADVPKGLDENVEFRMELLRAAKDNQEFQRQVWIMCKRDILFWLNAVCWTYDPRKLPSALPFLTWDYQDDAIYKFCETLENKRRCVLEKSRDMGASWLGLAVFTHRWQFYEGQSFLLGSRKEEYVDKSGDPKTLFWKVDYLLKNQPGWLLPIGFDWGTHRNKLSLVNPENGSVISGESANKDFGRGDRRTGIIIDELAAIENSFAVMAAAMDTSPCIFSIGTPQGMDNALYDLASNPHVPKIRMHWTQHPEKAAGLYQFRDGEIQILDAGYRYPKEYDFIRDGKVRSPWYDLECRERPPIIIAQELDINYEGSGGSYYDAHLIKKVKEEMVREPVQAGTLLHSVEGEVNGFRREKDGLLKLWVNLDEMSRPPVGEYVIGADIGRGTGSSNSTLLVWDKNSGEQVAEYASAFEDKGPAQPHTLGRLAVALCRWFHDAFLVFERNGPGVTFGREVVNVLGYHNVYYQRDEIGDRAKETDKPGWFNKKDAAEVLHGDFFRGMAQGKCVVRSLDVTEELPCFILDSTAGILNSKSRLSMDPTGAKENHADRVIAAALAWKGCRYVTAPQAEPEADVVELGSLQWRRDYNKQKARRQEAWA